MRRAPKDLGQNTAKGAFTWVQSNDKERSISIPFRAHPAKLLVAPICYPFCSSKLPNPSSVVEPNPVGARDTLPSAKATRTAPALSPQAFPPGVEFRRVDQWPFSRRIGCREGELLWAGGCQG